MAGQRKRYSAELKTKVALKAIKGHKTANEIAAEYGVHPTQIAQWKKQALDGLPTIFSTRASEQQISPQIRAQVTAIASSLPRQCQVPLARWSRAELARHVAQDPTLPPISASTVGRWLKAERLRPWRSHAWQHTHDPLTFLERACPVLEAYAQAQALLRAGTWLVSLDEKTSIQAREGEQPHSRARPGKPLLHEARSHRRGARHLFAGLSVADGKVYGTSRQRKCFADFQAFVEQVIEFLFSRVQGLLWTPSARLHMLLGILCNI